MDKEYTRALDIIWKAKVDLKKIYDNAAAKTFEDKKAYKAIERLVESLENTEETIEHYNKPAKDGTLMEDVRGKFYIEFSDGSSSYPFSCGSSIEVYLKDDPEEDIDQGWYSGRVEHNGEGYYFYGANKPMLYTGMRARVREW